MQLQLLLVHEMIGTGGQEARYGCEFGDFFRSPPDGTPGDLQGRGIYATIAVAMKGGAWREASMAMLAQAVAGKEDKAGGGKPVGNAAMLAKARQQRSVPSSPRWSILGRPSLSRASRGAPNLVAKKTTLQSVMIEDALTVYDAPAPRRHAALDRARKLSTDSGAGVSASTGAPAPGPSTDRAVQEDEATTV